MAAASYYNDGPIPAYPNQQQQQYPPPPFGHANDFRPPPPPNPHITRPSSTPPKLSIPYNSQHQKPSSYTYANAHPVHPSTTYIPLSQSHSNPPKRPKPSRKPSRGALSALKKFNRLPCLIPPITELVTTALNATMAGIMVYANIMYYKTRNETDPSGQRFWPEDSKVWPSWLMLFTSLFGIGSAVVTFFFACVCNRRKGDEEGGGGGGGRGWKFMIMRYALHILIWIAVGTIYRLEKGDKDLWGWSCSAKAQAVQQASNGKVDFGALCSAQGSSWQTSIGEFAVKIGFAVLHWFVRRKVKGAERKFGDGIGDAGEELLQSIATN